MPTRKESIIYKTLLPEILKILKKNSLECQAGDKTAAQRETASQGLTQSVQPSTPKQDSHQALQEVSGVQRTRSQFVTGMLRLQIWVPSCSWWFHFADHQLVGIRCKQSDRRSLCSPYFTSCLIETRSVGTTILRS